jgi:2,3-bisphosphoglycerate-dependent phosphoglycerate mutase
LTEIGHQQAAAVAEHLAQQRLNSPVNQYNSDNRKGFGITHIYSSLMCRAVQTAHTIAEKLGLPIFGRTDLHEWGGIYEWDLEREDRVGLPGRERTYFEEYFPRLNLPTDFNDSGWWNRPHEPHADVPARVRRVFRFLRSTHRNSDDRVLVVTHGGFLNYFLGHVLGLSPKQSQKNLDKNKWLVTNNTAIARIDIKPEFTGIIYINRTLHLPDDLIT